MGQIDTTLRYNGIYNSYEMGANDTLHASVFDTQYLSHITTQFVAVRVSGTIVDGWIEAIWIDANGAQVGSTQTVTWTPTRLWKRYTHTFAVPTGAVKVKLTYKSGAAGYHFSCPMTEAGEIASAYNAQTAAQLAYHTAQGSYVGFLNAGQIVAGVLRSVDGSAFFDLDKPEIVQNAVIGGRNVKLTVSPTDPLRVDVEGEKTLYVSPHTGKIVTSRYDINEDGFVDSHDMDIIFNYIYGGAEYPDWILERADLTGNGVINSNDMSALIDNMTQNYHDCIQAEREMTYKNANNLSFVDALSPDIVKTKMYSNNRVYPICITEPINAQIARSYLYVKPLNNSTYDEEILLYDPQGGFTSTSTATVRYLYKRGD